jgi:hypothetical protein
MFKGRVKQIRNSLEAIFQPNQSLIVIGERGVGTSSHIIYDRMKDFGNEIP